MSEKGRAWVKLDTGYYDDDKIIAAGIAAELLFVRSIAFSGARLTDGYIRKEQLPRIAVGIDDVAGAVKQLTAKPEDGHRPLWQVVKGGWRITAFLDWNESAEEIQRKRELYREIGSRGGRASAQRRQKKARDDAPEKAEVTYHREPPGPTEPEAAADALPVAADWDARRLMQQYRKLARQHNARHNELQVQNALHQLHTSREVADELGAQLTMDEAVQILRNWLEWRRPIRVAELLGWSEKHAAPWWAVCLRGAAPRQRSGFNGSPSPEDILAELEQEHDLSE